MYNITLISSKHIELGKCNSSTLIEIIKSVNPDVIFEEFAQSHFDLYYGESPTKFCLESIAITNFLKVKKSKQVLVDTIDFPLNRLLKDYQMMINDLLNSPDQNGCDLKEAIYQNKLLVFDLGFNYLNSNKSEINQFEINRLIYNSLVHKNNKAYFETLEQWQNFNDFRESHMIESVYKFSEANKFKDAVFTLGVAHRNSIKDKIEKYQEHSRLKLNWKFYGD